MVRRFVKKKQVGLQRERERKGRLLSLASRGGLGQRLASEREPVKVLIQLCKPLPAVALVCDRGQRAAGDKRIAQREILIKPWLLLKVDGAQAVLLREFSALELFKTGKHLQERTFPSAVSADEPDPLSRLDGQGCVIKERHVAPGELGFS